MRVSHFPMSHAKFFLRRDVEVAITSLRLVPYSPDHPFSQTPAIEIMNICNMLQNTLSDFQRSYIRLTSSSGKVISAQRLYSPGPYTFGYFLFALV